MLKPWLLLFCLYNLKKILNIIRDGGENGTLYWGYNYLLIYIIKQIHSFTQQIFNVCPLELK